LKPTARATQHVDDLLTEGEVATLLGVDLQTITRWEADGTLIAVIDADGRGRYRASDLAAILVVARRSVAPPAPTTADDDFGYEGWEDTAAVLQFLRHSKIHRSR
jgi:hypothetical protein